MDQRLKRNTQSWVDNHLSQFISCRQQHIVSMPSLKTHWTPNELFLGAHTLCSETWARQTIHLEVCCVDLNCITGAWYKYWRFVQTLLCIYLKKFLLPHWRHALNIFGLYICSISRISWDRCSQKGIYPSLRCVLHISVPVSYSLVLGFKIWKSDTTYDSGNLQGRFWTVLRR